jgi:hypothetical protein
MARRAGDAVECRAPPGPFNGGRMETYLARIKALLNEAGRELSEDEYEELLDGASDELDERRDLASDDSDRSDEWEPEDD